MSTTYHTEIAAGAAGNASVFNAPLGQLDAHLGDAMTFAVNNNAELVAARSPYPSLDARLDALVMAGGNVATKANGVSAAGQKVLTVDATTGFIVGAYVTYLLNGATLEGNTIASIQAGVSLTLGTNIGTGGVLDDSYISMISTSEYLAAQAIPHAGTLMLPQTIQIINRRRHNAEARGLSEAASATVNTAALIAAIDAAAAESTSGVVEVQPGTFEINGPIDCKDVRIVGAAGSPGVATVFKATHASAGFILRSQGCLSDFCFDGDSIATVGITIDDVSEFQLRNVYVINCVTAIKITETSIGSGIGTFDGLVTSVCTVSVEMACSISSTFWFRACNFWDCPTVFKFTGASGSSLIIRDCWFEKFVTAFDLSPISAGIGWSHLVVDSNHFISTLPVAAGVYTCRIFKSTITADLAVTFTNVVFSGNFIYLTKAAYVLEIDWGAYIGSGTNRFEAIFRDNYFAWNPGVGTNLVAWVKSDCAQPELVKIGWENNTDNGRSLLVQDGAQPMNKRANFAALDATPSVASRDDIYYTYNYGGATTITGFDGGYAGQRFILVFPDANTTIDFSGTNLKGNAGVDWAAAVGDWLEAIFDGTDWYCSVHDCTA